MVTEHLSSRFDQRVGEARFLVHRQFFASEPGLHILQGPTPMNWSLYEYFTHMMPSGALLLDLGPG